MEFLKKIKWSRYLSFIIIGIFAVLSAILAISCSVSGEINNTFREYIPMLKSISVNMLLAVSLSVVVGFLGELSL